MAQVEKVRTPAEEAELAALMKSQRKDLRKDGERALPAGEIRHIDRRRAKREKQAQRDRRREVNFDDLDPIN